MNSLLIALVPLFSFGFSNFLSSRASKKMGALQSAFLFQFLGIPWLLLTIPFVPIPANINYLYLITIGIFQTLVMCLFFYALKIGDVSIISPIVCADVLVSVFLATILFHEPVTLPKIISMLVVLTGVILISTQIKVIKKLKSVSINRGVIPAIIATIGMGIFGYLCGVGSRENGWFYTTFIIRITISLATLFIILIKHNTISRIFKDMSWKWITLSAFFDVIGFSAFNYAIIHNELSYVSIIIAGAPFVTVVLARIFTDERLRFYQIAGLFMIVTGIVFIYLK